MKRVGIGAVAVALSVVLLAPSMSAPVGAADKPDKLRIGIHRAMMGSFDVIADRNGY